MSELIAALRQRLNRPGVEVSEHALIKELVEEGLLPAGFNDGSLALFQTHFLLFNALYRLQDDLASHQLALEIGLVNIRVREQQVAQSSALDVGRQASLREYYLDWSHFNGATEESVDELLERFWQQYGPGQVATSEKAAALASLQLTEPVTYAEIKMRYRRLVMREHPDRGGDNARLQDLNDAMAVLARAYKPC